MNKAIVTVGSLVVGLLLVGGAYLMAGDRSPDGGADSGPDRRSALVDTGPVTQAELAAADGQAGRPCLVAVDGTVYQINGFTLWQEGQHIPSEGQAYCGADMSEVMRRAPHGTTKLDLLREVGPLVG